jgi:hypothetical protein
MVNPISSCYHISRSRASSIDIIETKADPEGLGRKNFKIYTQTICFNQKL